ncbi:MAG TPA: ABC transporter permease [Gemmatimonadaceae bacterium]|nr:ABC transporter permease [Gemmatimonadaceae bacterium]
MTDRDDRLYRALLRLYPADFRARYGRAMRDFHRDRFAVARSSGESIALLWLRTFADVAVSATAEHMHSFFSGDAVMETIVQDLAYSTRSLARRPGFTAIVIATIALGVGANAAIFSVVNGILLRPLSYPHAERLFLFGHEPPQWLTSQPDFVDYHNGMGTLQGLAAYTRLEGTLTDGGEPERVRVVRGSEEFFPVLGVAPLLGRGFAADEFVPKRAPTAIISYGLWQRRFGGDRSIVGRKLSIEGFPRTVVGVMPPRFDFPETRTDVWMPLTRFNLDSLDDRNNHYLFMVGRLKPGVPLQRAYAEATTIAQRIMRTYPAQFDPKAPLHPHLTSVTEELVGKTQPYLLALLGAAAFVLLIACSNVANLLLARGETRHKEMAVRSALGASGFRLVSQVLSESGLLAIIGGGLGLLLAWAGDRALIALAPASIPRLDAVGIDWRVVTFAAVVATITGLLIGLIPARRAATGNTAEALQDGGRVVDSRGGARAMRRTLVVAEIGLAVVTLSGAGMLLRSLWNLQHADLGFEPHGVLTAKIALPANAYDDARTPILFAQLLDRVRALPGVKSAGASGWLPVVDAGGLWGFRPEGGNYPDGRWPQAVPQQATPGYFEAIGIPIIAGRGFTASDAADAPLVAVVSRRFAELSWPGKNAVGQRFRLAGDSPLMTVVGVAGDIQMRGFGDIPEPTMFFPHAQSGKSAYFTPRSMAIIVRVGGDPSAFAPSLRNVVHSLDRNIPVSEMRTLDQVVGTSVSNRRFNTALLAGFAALALLLAGIGTYGVISYGVTQRSFEIGVRMALGAENRSVLALVMSEGMRLTFVGLAIGLVVSAGVGRAIRSMLVGVPPVDVPSLVLTAVLLVLVATVASALPARRALRVSPLDALRSN